MNGLLSVIIPAYNEQEMIPKAAATIAEILEQAEISYELLFVNDGSRDLSWQCIEEAADQNPSIRGLNFSRNFGKESAMFAGDRKSTRLNSSHVRTSRMPSSA